MTDVRGLRVGSAHDAGLKSGATVVLCEPAAVAGVQVLGGAPGTRETDMLEPHNAVEAVHAIALSGGSAFGLDAASGVQAALREDGVGFAVREARVPLVPGAILFDLTNGGNKAWGRYPPYRELGFAAARAAGLEVALGSVGAGYGALTAGLKGGLGTASAVLPSGVTVAALVAVNALGSATLGRTRHFWAAPWEIGAEFGALGWSAPLPADAQDLRLKFREEMGTLANTTIGVVATDAALTKAGAKRLAAAAHDGFARALWPAHTPGDGDLVFGLATGAGRADLAPDEAIELYAAAGAVMARAIARGVFAAAPAEAGDVFPAWCESR